MRLSTLLVIAGILALLHGLAFLFAPVFTLQQYAITTDGSGLVMTRLYGTALLTLGLVVLTLRDLPAPSGSRVALAICVGNLAGFWVTLRNQLAGNANAVGWSAVAIYGVLALALATFAFGKTQRA
jgi:hypothetical protein